MPPDLGTLLRDTVDDPIDPIDLETIGRTAKRRTRHSRMKRAAAGIMVIVAAATYAQLDDSGRGKTQAQAGSTTTAPHLDEARGFNLLAPDGFDDTIVIGAPVGYEATGSLVAIDQHNGVAHQRIGTVPLWPGDAMHPLLIVGDRVIWAGANDKVWATSTDLRDDPAVIGAASFLLPSATPGNIWMINQNPLQATETDVHGTIAQSARDLPTNGWPHADVDGGLLVSTPGGLVIWDPANGDTRRVYDDRAVLAAAGDHAYLGAGLQLELSTGDVSFLGVAPGSNERAAYSPDGRQLAVFTWTPNTGRELVNIYSDGGTEPRVYDLTGNIRTSRLSWSSDSTTLYILASARDDSSAERIIGIPLGGSATTIATINQRGWYWIASN